MKQSIQLIEMGFYHPSSANWSYHIHLVIDGTGARLYRETFGGDSRMVENMKKKGIEVERMSAGIGSMPEHKWKDVSRMPDLEKYDGKNWGEGSL